jgi:gamma-glutamylaminecyclotransferase
MFKALDALEEYPTWYDREEQEMELTDGSKMNCWVYLLKSYPENLLKLPFISNYESAEGCAYTERSRRTISARDDLEFGI